MRPAAAMAGFPAEQEAAEAQVRSLLGGVGEEPGREGLRDTPKVRTQPSTADQPIAYVRMRRTVGSLVAQELLSSVSRVYMRDCREWWMR